MVVVEIVIRIDVILLEKETSCSTELYFGGEEGLGKLVEIYQMCLLLQNNITEFYEILKKQDHKDKHLHLF